MRKMFSFLTVAVLALATSFAACDDAPSGPAAPGEASARGAAGASGLAGGPHTFAPPVFDIESGPNGNLLVPVTVFPVPEVPPEGATSTSTVVEIRRNGDLRDWAEVTTVEGSPINGLITNGQADLVVTSGSTDEAVGAGLWQVSRGGQRLLGDIETFEVQSDPDLFAIDDWKDPACAAASGPFTAGPQSNPYHLAAVSGGTFLVADAAGNTLLRIGREGHVELLALFTPPTEDGGASGDPDDWLEFPFEGAADGDCYVQPVPTSVALGPDGSVYVGELTGVGALGVSRVWRIDPGARDVTCPSAACEVTLTGFTSILDLAFGPEGDLFVVEYDEAGWLTSLGVGTPAGGTINACDVATGSCRVVEDELIFPAAVTFDRRGGLWVLENNLVEPTVHRVD